MKRPGVTSRGIPAGMFVLVGLCFFLPFVAVSCGPWSLERTGVDMAVTGEAEVSVDENSRFFSRLQEGKLNGRALEGLEDLFPRLAEGIDEFGESLKQAAEEAVRERAGDLGVEFLASLALLSAAAGVGVAFLPDRMGTSGVLMAAVLGGASLAALRLQVESDLVPTEAPAGPVTISWQIGWWLALLLFAATAVWAVMVLVRKEPPAPPSDPVPSPGA